MFGDIFGILWSITKWFALFCIWCVLMRFVLHRFLKIANKLMKWFVLPLVKDIIKMKKTINKTKEQAKPEPANTNKVKADAEIILD